MVLALPGPSKGGDRRAVGDPQLPSIEGPLFSLLLRLGDVAISPLLERISNPQTSPELRGQLVLVLAEAPSPSALSVLGELLLDRSEPVRTAALSVLRSFPPSSSLRALSKSLHDQLDKSEERRSCYAIDALCELRDASIVPQLISMLEDADPAVSEAARRGLVTLTKQDFGDSGWRWKSWWQKNGPKARLSWLLAGLSHGDALIRSSAFDELSTMSGDIAGYRYDDPKRERELARKRWAEWWQRRGYQVE